MKYLIYPLFLFASFSVSAKKISVNEVSRFVGNKVTVCGKVAQISKVGIDSFINLNKPHPYQNFYFYSANQTLSQKYLLKNVCGTGLVEKHNGKYQIKIDLKKLSFE